jgi:hypothetical protein
MFRLSSQQIREQQFTKYLALFRIMSAYNFRFKQAFIRIFLDCHALECIAFSKYSVCYIASFTFPILIRSLILCNIPSNVLIQLREHITSFKDC